MEHLSLTERLELIMARRQATKALKFISTQHSKHSMAYELQGEL